MDKKDILYNFIQDNQENIRFIESKTAIITAIIGAVIVYYLQGIEKFIKYFEQISCCNIIVLILVITSTIISCYYLFKVILPISNPKSKLPSEYHSYPNIYLSEKKLNINNSDLTEYRSVFENEKSIENSIELEYLKTSLIRNEKLKNFKRLSISIIVLILLFLLHVLIFQKDFIDITN
ncbi:MAG TPA: hypothetical protein PKX92_10355 [Edaphocola sp.]|nr:hypothetical protein [Edaphocola sp.]